MCPWAIRGYGQDVVTLTAVGSSRRHTIGLIPASTTRSWYIAPVTATPRWATMPIVPVSAAARAGPGNIPRGRPG